jgi:alpha/beta superfamily hydrolase
MNEERIFFSSNGIEIDGLFHSTPGENGVVVTHPHPLYGGSMHNGVVESLVRIYQRHEYTTLRFNFRGVGRSQGKYDQGQGEQVDVNSALQHLYEKNKKVIDLAGYSFGAWVNTLARPPEETVHRIIMISPPVAFLDFGSVPTIPQLKLVVSGSHDEIAPPDIIETMLPQWNSEARFEVIEGADHFYGGYTARLESVLHDYLTED